MKTLATLVFGVLLGAASLAPAQGPAPAADEQVMHSFGALAGQAVLCNYMAIAELADLYGAKAYDKDKCKQLAGMYVAVSQAAKESLTDLIDSGKLNASDDAGVKEIVIINDHLVNLAQAAISFMDDPDQAKHASYEKIRQKAWKSITKLLGIEE